MTTTKTKGITLYPHEVKAALRGELTCIVRPVKPQPGNDIDPNRLRACQPMFRRRYAYMGNPDLDPPCEISLRCPYPPGTEAYGRERWRAFGGDDPRIEYHAGGVLETAFAVMLDSIPETPAGVRRAARELDGETVAPEWRSSQQMPEAISRFSILFKSVEVKRVGDATLGEIRAMGDLNGWMLETEPRIDKVCRTRMRMHHRDGVDPNNPEVCRRATFERWWDATFQSHRWSTSPWAWFHTVEVKVK